jgi:energy-coupling factor transporter ATP-binding protein EcfA2
MQITKIMAKGLGGLDFEQPIGHKTLFLGPNGVGKSARSKALQLALLGYIPGLAKTNREILEICGSGDVLFVGLGLSDKTHLIRRWSRDEKGTVSENFMLDRKKCNRDKYIQAIAGIKILDLSAFLALSDQKKIDIIFNLFPCSEDLADLDRKIEFKKTAINRLQADIKALDTTQQRLRSARAEIQLPAGTLAEVSAEIERTEKMLSDARNALQDARIEAARVEEQEKAAASQISMFQRPMPTETVPLPTVADPIPTMTTPIPTVSDPIPTMTTPIPTVSDPVPGQTVESLPVSSFQPQPVEEDSFLAFNRDEAAEMSLRSVIATMERAGCTACAARLVAIRELRKFQKREVA